MSFSWNSLPKPFYALAPMEGATDTAFRQVIADIGKPDVMFTEFVNVEGLMSRGKSRLEPMLKFAATESPLIVQLWGLDPNNFKTIAAEMVDRGFAGVDINMGCPVKDVIKKGTGSALINSPSLAAEIIAAVKEGVAGRVPVSVKTRIGFNHIITQDWCGFLLSQSIAALTVHGRTTKEQSKVPAHWDEIGLVAKLNQQMKLSTTIIGNGDVLTRIQGLELAKAQAVDGIMIGRGIFHNPWLFNPTSIVQSPESKISTLIKHLDYYHQAYHGTHKPFDPMKRFFKIYINGFPAAAALREQLMLTKSISEAKSILQNFKIPCHCEESGLIHDDEAIS